MNNKQNILFIINGPIDSGGKITISGGDVRLFEIIKHIKGFNINILTTPNGQKLLKKFNIPYKKIHLIGHILNNTIFSHLIIFIKSFFNIPSSIKNYQGIVYSSCEHLYDILPAFKLKIFNQCKWYAVYHNVYDYPWIEKRGNTPLLRKYIYWLNRWFSGLIIKLFADQILAVSHSTKKRLVSIKKIRPQRIKAVNCGVDLSFIDQIQAKNQIKQKKYDAVFLGRLDHAKGVIDLIDIWGKVCQKMPKAKLLVIGSGSDGFKKEIDRIINRKNLVKNIKFVGTVYSPEEKYTLLNSAKIFVFPSHQENWGIAIGEAMASKLPVIAYSLAKIKPIWKDNVVWIRSTDNNTFANQIIKYLNKPKLRKQLSDKAYNFIKKYDWQKIAQEEI